MSRMVSRVIQVTAPILVVFVLAGCGSAESPGVATAQSQGPAPSPALADAVNRQEKMLAFVRCMREAGVNLDDPDSAGNLTLKQDDKTNPNYPKAYEGCKKLMPAGGAAPPAFTAEQLNMLREYAKCMRDNGVTDFADPGPNGFTIMPKDQVAVAKANTVCAVILGVNPSATGGQG